MKKLKKEFEYEFTHLNNLGGSRSMATVNADRVWRWILKNFTPKVSRVELPVKPDACGKWQKEKPNKPCYFIHRYTKKDNKPDLYDAYVDGGVLSVANIQDDEFICTMEEFADGEFYIVEYH